MADSNDASATTPPDASTLDALTSRKGEASAAASPDAPTIAKATTTTTTTTSTTPQPNSPLPHAVDDSLLQVFRYVSSVPGKNVRGMLIDCFQSWLQVESTDILATIKDIVGDLHNASLLIDDIEDGSKLRRGIPVAHAIFGIPTTINTANYVYFLALEKAHALQNDDVLKVFCGELLNLHRGQGRDIAWREAVTCPTEQEYLDMVCDKTGGLFRLAVGLMQCFGTNARMQSTNLTPLVNHLAMYFQMRDDYINLADATYMKSKSFCEDLTEGKFSLPMIHGVQHSPPGDDRLLSILKQRTTDVDVKRYAQKLLQDLGSLAYTREKCRQFKETMVEQIAALGGNPALLKLIEHLDIQLQQLHDDSQATAAATSQRQVDVDEA